MYSHPFMYLYTQLPSEVPYRGNMLLNLLAGAKVLLVQPRADISRDDHLKIIHVRMEQYADKLRWELTVACCVWWVEVCVPRPPSGTGGRPVNFNK